MNQKLRVGVVGAGRWAVRSHIPGGNATPAARWWRWRTPSVGGARCRGQGVRRRQRLETDYRALIDDPDIDVIDVGSPATPAHFPVSWAALEAGKHVLCEKPVAHDFPAIPCVPANWARSKGLKTKLGFTFRYSPAMQ